MARRQFLAGLGWAVAALLAPASRPAGIPPSPVDRTLDLLDRLSSSAGNRDAVDRVIRLIFGRAEPAPWRTVQALPPATRRPERQALARRLLEERVTPARLWARVAEAVAANQRNSEARLDAAKIIQFIEGLNAKPYDGMYEVWHGHSVTVPHELVIAVLLKETDGFHAKAAAQRDGHGLMQINRTTLLDKEFWALLQRYQLVTQAFDAKLPRAAVERILFDPTTNVQVGILYLRELLARLVARVPSAPSEQIQFALMAYNTGPTWTFGLDNPLNGGELLGGALKLARQYRVPLVFDTVAARSLRGTPLYRVPIQYLDERGRRLRIQLREPEFRGGLDYVRTVWATSQVLLQLVRPLASPAGLEERGAGFSRRHALKLLGGVAAGLGISGVPSGALGLTQAAPTAPAGDTHQFLLGPWLVSVINGKLVRSHLEDLRQPIIRTPADRPLRFARIHQGRIYAVGTGGAVYRLDEQDQLRRVLTLDDDPADTASTVITDLAFLGDTAYVVADESSAVPSRQPPGGFAEFPHIWRIEAYSIAADAGWRPVQRQDLVRSEGAGREPGVGMLEIVGGQWAAVTLGEAGVRILPLSALDQTVATLPLQGVTALRSQGPVLYAAEAGVSDRGSRLTAWDLANPVAEAPARDIVLPTASPVQGLAIGPVVLYLTTGSELLTYAAQGKTWIPAGQLTFRGEVHDLNVRDQTAYVIQRFVDGNAVLHTVDVMQPDRLVYSTQYADLGEITLPLAVSRSGQASVRVFRINDITQELRFYDGFERGASYLLPSSGDPALRATYTQDEQFVFLVVEAAGRASHAVYVIHHQTGRPWLALALDPETQSRFRLTDSHWHGVRENRVQLEYRVIRFDGTEGELRTMIFPLAPPPGGLEEPTVLEAKTLDTLAVERQFVVFGVHPDDIEQQLGGLVRQLAVRRASIALGILTSGAGIGTQDGQSVEVGVQARFMRKIHGWADDREVAIVEKIDQRRTEALEGARRLDVSSEAVTFFGFGAGDTRTENLDDTLDAAAQTRLIEFFRARMAADARPLTVVYHDPEADRHPAHFKSATLLRAAIQQVVADTKQPIDVWAGGLSATDSRTTHWLPMTVQDHQRKSQALAAHQTQVLHYAAKKDASGAETMHEWLDRVAAAAESDRARVALDAPYVERYQRATVAPPQGGLEERVSGWIGAAMIPTGTLPGVVGRVHARALATPKVVVLFDRALSPVIGDAMDRWIRWAELGGQTAAALGRPSWDLRLGEWSAEAQADAEQQGYRAIRVMQDLASTPGVLPLSAVPLVAAQAAAAGGPTFLVVPAAYVGLEGVTLTESLATITDLFA